MVTDSYRENGTEVIDIRNDIEHAVIQFRKYILMYVK